MYLFELAVDQPFPDKCTNGNYLNKRLKIFPYTSPLKYPMSTKSHNISEKCSILLSAATARRISSPGPSTFNYLGNPGNDINRFAHIE